MTCRRISVSQNVANISKSSKNICRQVLGRGIRTFLMQFGGWHCKLLGELDKNIITWFLIGFFSRRRILCPSSLLSKVWSEQCSLHLQKSSASVSGSTSY